MGLAGEITKDVNAEMSYLNYETNIVHRYGVELVGWPLDILSLDGVTTSKLQKVVDGMTNGSIHWVRLTEEQLIARIEAWKVRDVTQEAKKKKRTRTRKKVHEARDLEEPRSSTTQSSVVEESTSADLEELPA